MPTQNEKIRAVLIDKNITIGTLNSMIRDLKLQVRDLKLLNKSLGQIVTEQGIEIKRLRGEI